MMVMYKNNTQGASSSSYGDPLASYIGENGITIISYSPNWKSEDKLKAIYNELLKNTHGTEIAYLSTVYIYPNKSSHYSNDFSSFYHEDYSVNKYGRFVFGHDCTIEIYDADQYKDISQMARVLAHEYGHHFTFYYLMTEENLSKDKWIKSKYAKIRKLEDFPLVTYLGENQKTYSHEWDIAEILAEDYIQLYGSQLARKSRDYLDVKERIISNNIDYYYYYSDFNLLPQENLDLELAADVEGLVDYLNDLSRVMPSRQPEKIVVKQPILSTINNVYKSYNEYIWEWPKVNFIEMKNQYEYTLVINPSGENDYPLPLKTAYSGEVLTAVTGSALDLKKGLGIMTNFEGDYEVRVFVKDRNGFMHSSLFLPISIKPRDNSKILFYDVPIDYWCNDYIYDLTNRELVRGYSDQTFHPESTITRAEFMTFLIRSLKDIEPQENQNTSHWFIEQGFRDVALSLGLLSSENNNELYFEGNISREEMAQMICFMLNYSGIKVNIAFKTTLTDTKDSVAFTEISIVNYYKIINGYPDQTFKPNNNATRSEAMIMISKYLSTVGL